MVRAFAYLLSLCAHVTVLVVVGRLGAGAIPTSKPWLVASGRFVIGAAADLDERIDVQPPTLDRTTLPPPPTPLPPPPPSEVPSADSLRDLPPSAEPNPGEPAAEADTGDGDGGSLAVDVPLPFGVAPVSTRVVPLHLGPSRPAASPIETAAASLPTSHPLPEAAGGADVIDEAATLSSPTAAYPLQAVDQRLEGTVTLLAQVAADGKVASCEIETSSGHDLLDRAALRALPKWRFKPRLVNGVAQPFKARVPFHFGLTGAAGG